jgi:hypothetical protein
VSARGGKHTDKGAVRRRRRGSMEEERPLHRDVGRRSRAERVVYVACEGESTERDYLVHLNEEFGAGDDDRQPFRIQPIWRKNGLLPTQAVAEARRYAETDEAWALFDRDGKDRDPDIEAALKEAAAAKVEVGFSHPSFDLWVLLHFQPLSGAQSGSSKIVVDKLRSARDAKGFKDYDKRNDKSLKGARRDALTGRHKTAVDNAKALVGACPHGACKAGQARTKPVSREATPASPANWSARSGHAPHCPALKRDPSTDVWRLLAALGVVPAAH